jgi:hypothetical protein
MLASATFHSVASTALAPLRCAITPKPSISAPLSYSSPIPVSQAESVNSSIPPLEEVFSNGSRLASLRIRNDFRLSARIDLMVPQVLDFLG